MIKKKVVMLGSFAVGKTSLVQRYVNSIFSDKYHTTIGVKIDQKQLAINGAELNMLIWDIHGEDDYQKVKPTYIIGASGCIIVIDGTRRASLEVGCELCQLAKKTAPESSLIVLINKSDLKDEWEISEEDLARIRSYGYTIIETSAKTNDAVDHAFESLGRSMLNS